jgi:hypothetical protein
VIRARYPMPDDIAKALKAAGLRQQYDGRPNYQRNDCIGWIDRARTAKTRAKALLKCSTNWSAAASIYEDATPGERPEGMRSKCSTVSLVDQFGRSMNSAWLETTAMYAVAGLQPIKSGSIELFGRPLVGRSPEEISREGLALVPQGRRIFKSLTVQENLDVARGRGNATRSTCSLALSRHLRRLRSMITFNERGSHPIRRGRGRSDSAKEQSVVHTVRGDVGATQPPLWGVCRQEVRIQANRDDRRRFRLRT